MLNKVTGFRFLKCIFGYEIQSDKLLLCFLSTYWALLLSHQNVCDIAIKANSVLLPLGRKQYIGYWKERHKAIQNLKLIYLLEDFTLVLNSWVTVLKASLFLFLKQILGITSKMKVLHCLTLTIWAFCLALLCLMKKWICTSTFKDPPHSHTSIIPSEALRVCSRHQTEGALDRGLPCLCFSGGFIIWQASFRPWNWFIKFCFFCDFLHEFWPSEAVKNECGLSEIKAVSWKKTLNPMWRLYKISQKVQAFLREGRSMMTRVTFSELWEGCGKEYFLLTYFLKFVHFFQKVLDNHIKNYRY